METKDPSPFLSIEGFEAFQRMAKLIAASDMVPKRYQNNISNCVVALEMATRCQVPVLAAMQHLDIIEGEPSWDSKFVIAMLNSCGRFTPLKYHLGEPGPEETVAYTTYEWHSRERKKVPVAAEETIQDRICYAWAYDRDGHLLRGPEVSLKMAVKEGWYNRRGSKWQIMPELMLHYRAATMFGNVYAPELGIGMTPPTEPVTPPIHAVATEPPAMLPAFEAAGDLLSQVLDCIQGAEDLDGLDEAEDLIRELSDPRDIDIATQALNNKKTRFPQPQEESSYG